MAVDTYFCQVVTSWIEKPGRRDMRIAEDHPVGTWTDITGQPDANLPCDPNALVVEGSGIPENDMTLILADPNAVVLWYDVEVDGG